MATVRVPPLSMPSQTGSEGEGLRCRMGRVFVPGNGRQGEWAAIGVQGRNFAKDEACGLR